MIAALEKLDSEKLKKDLYNKYGTILSVDEVLFMQLPDLGMLTFLKIKVFVGELTEYKVLKREIRKRLLNRFNIKHVNIELDW